MDNNQAGLLIPARKHSDIVVVVPARNEEDQIGATLESIFTQTLSPDQVIVVVNNSSDTTHDRALEMGVTVLDMKVNHFKKAGALNFGIASLSKMPSYIVTIDADTILDPSFLERALSVMERDPCLGGLSAVCRGKPDLGRTPYERLLCWMQRTEYNRASRTRIRTNIHTLSGAGSVLRGAAVSEVISDRGVLYAERRDNLVEDYEATLEIKNHGWEATNNFHCVAYTDMMLSLRALVEQRVRWARGSLLELRRRGVRKETRTSIGTLIYGYAGIALFWTWVGLMINEIAHDRFTLITVGFFGLMGLYQAATLGECKFRTRILAFLLIPEMFYNVIRHFWLVSSLVRALMSRAHEWH